MSLTKVTYSMIEGSMVNVIDFGAVGDGVADDAAAIQLAENFASANDKSVYFPSGVYLCGSTLYRKGNTDWHGEGMYLSILKHSGGAATHTLVYVDNLDADYSHIGFYSLGFNGNRSGSADPNANRDMIFLDRNVSGGVQAPSKDIRFIGCHVFNYSFGGHGFHSKGYTGVQVKDSIFEDGSGDTLYHPIYVRRCADVEITGNTSIANATNHCIKVQLSPQSVVADNILREGERGILIQDGEQTTVIGNSIFDCGTGISLTIDTSANNLMSVVGNVIDTCETGIQVSNSNFGTIANNVITGFSQYGVTLRAALEFSVSGNMLRTADSGGGAIDFVFLDAGPSPNRVALTGNLLRNNRPSGTTNGVVTNETTLDNIFVSNNNLSALSGWTAQYVGINPALIVDVIAGVVVNGNSRVSTLSQSEIHSTAALTGSPAYSAYNWRNEDRPSSLRLAKSRSGTIGTNGSSVQNLDELGRITFLGDHNGTFLNGAQIIATVNGVPTPATDDLPTDLAIQTRSAGSANPTTRLTVKADGNIIPVLPTSSAGLPSGALWNDGGTVKVA